MINPATNQRTRAKNRTVARKPLTIKARRSQAMTPMDQVMRNLVTILTALQKILTRVLTVVMTRQIKTPMVDQTKHRMMVGRMRVQPMSLMRAAVQQMRHLIAGGQMDLTIRVTLGRVQVVVLKTKQVIRARDHRLQRMTAVATRVTPITDLV